MTMPESPARGPREVSLGALLWIGIGAVFVLVRLAGVLSMPVGGAELDALSGAWQAHEGHTGVRFIPTLFQGLAAASFAFTSSEMPARFLALLASASVPFALYRLRPRFGEPAMLGALLLLAVDPASILGGSTATAFGFDVAVALWLCVLAEAKQAPRWAHAVAGFFAATSGGIVLPLLVAMAALRLVRQEYPRTGTIAWSLGGAVIGIAAASLGFGFGWQGVTIPPVAAFGAGFDREWSTESTGYLALVYASPIIAGALVAVAAQVYRGWRDQGWEASEVSLYAWFGAAMLWLLAAAGAHDPAPLVAVAIPAALIIGREVPAMASVFQRVDWQTAILPIAGVGFCLLVIEAYVEDWARVNRVGDADDQLIVLGVGVAVLACLGMLFSNRRNAGAILLAPITVGALIMLSGASGVAFGGPNEPMPSPAASVQGDEIRAIVEQAVKDHPGPVVVHASFESSMTWALRGGPAVTLATAIPADATAVIWPVTEPAPEGYSVVEGQWSFTQARKGPHGGFLPYLRWLTNRNILKNQPAALAVYLKAQQ